MVVKKKNNMRAVAANRKVKVLKCQQCKGTGYCTGPFSDYDTWKCDKCQGTGVIVTHD